MDAAHKRRPERRKAFAAERQVTEFVGDAVEGRVHCQAQGYLRPWKHLNTAGRQSPRHPLLDRLHHTGDLRFQVRIDRAGSKRHNEGNPRPRQRRDVLVGRRLQRPREGRRIGQQLLAVSARANPVLGADEDDVGAGPIAAELAAGCQQFLQHLAVAGDFDAERQVEKLRPKLQNVEERLGGEARHDPQAERCHRTIRPHRRPDLRRRIAVGFSDRFGQVEIPMNRRLRIEPVKARAIVFQRQNPFGPAAPLAKPQRDIEIRQGTRDWPQAFDPQVPAHRIEREWRKAEHCRRRRQRRPGGTAETRELGERHVAMPRDRLQPLTRVDDQLVDGPAFVDAAV